ncbi:MAG: hypothetical protein QW379_06135 [Thermoplasmata archaeon]
MPEKSSLHSIQEVPKDFPSPLLDSSTIRYHERTLETAIKTMATIAVIIEIEGVFGILRG